MKYFGFAYAILWIPLMMFLVYRGTDGKVAAGYLVINAGLGLLLGVKGRSRYENESLSDRILHTIVNSNELLTGRDIYLILDANRDIRPGSVASCIWNLVREGKVIVRTDMKVVAV